ncbi:hypothetical protein BsWGS_27802 [Bradybaena similaris]
MASRLLRLVQAKWQPVWAQSSTKSAAVMLSTALCVGFFFYPLLRPLFQAPNTTEQEMYSKDHLYPIKLRKQREQEREVERQKNVK